MSSYSFAGEILKIGSKIKAGYSKTSLDCEVVSFYGNMITLKSSDSGKNKIFYMLAENLGEGIFTPEAKFPKEDETLNEDIFVDSFVEACHPNSEWYVGKVIAKYGKFLKVQLGAKDWSPVWVDENHIFKSLKVEKEVKFMDYRHRQIAILDKEGVLKNMKDVAIGRVYSNGKVYGGNGEQVGSINQDGTIEKNRAVIFKSNIQCNNGLAFLDVENKPKFIIRIRSSSLYMYDRPDIVSLFFEADQLKGNMRVCAGLYILLKDKF
jgi:hypothetical protein